MSSGHTHLSCVDLSPVPVAHEASTTTSAGNDAWAAELNDPAVPLVVLDLASVETYLLVHLLSRTISEPGGAVWCPLESGPAELDRNHVKAERQARELDLPVKWPRGQWRPVPRAMRVAALAMARGRAEPYIRTMSRMAFATAIDVNAVSAPIQPERRRELDQSYYVAVDGDLGLDGTEVTLATQDSPEWDLRLKGVAAELAAIGIASAPAIRRNGEIRVGAHLDHRGRRAAQPAALKPTTAHESASTPLVVVTLATVLTYGGMTWRLRAHMKLIKANDEPQEPDRSFWWCLRHPWWRPAKQE